MGHHHFNDRLWEPPIDAIEIRLVYVPPAEWQLVIVHRHAGESWCTCSNDVYDKLANYEALQVIDATLTTWGFDQASAPVR